MGGHRPLDGAAAKHHRPAGSQASLTPRLDNDATGVAVLLLSPGADGFRDHRSVQIDEHLERPFRLGWHGPTVAYRAARVVGRRDALQLIPADERQVAGQALTVPDR